MNKEIKQMIQDIENKKKMAALAIEEKITEAYFFVVERLHVRDVIESVDWDDMNS